MINAALNGVSQDISAGTLRKNSNIPGLIVARLRAFEKHGLPQIPPGVDQKLMASLGIVDEDYCLRRLMMRVSFICLLPVYVVSSHCVWPIVSTENYLSFCPPCT